MAPDIDALTRQLHEQLQASGDVTRPSSPVQVHLVNYAKAPARRHGSEFTQLARKLHGFIEPFLEAEYDTASSSCSVPS